ncbi:MAG: hypothetical protein WC389_04980 [Lutibacter sp.]|jgi:hypothetical protein
MKKNYCFIALIVFLNLFMFASCTSDDAEENQLTITTQYTHHDTYAEGEEGTPIDKSKTKN